MAEIEREAAHGFTFYTYTYGDDPRNCARQFYETAEEARRDLMGLRAVLLDEKARKEPLRDMKIIRLRTRAITRRALVDLFNGLDGDLGGFILSREVVETIREPQLLSFS
ncbi:hypothetical protein [Agrobacterium pusense]|uniref:Uncharacterized protein n=1 Tax=Agrobacterium pusense TaxID=648995 RepID=A0A6H0ZT65_9HYPH|nr:hypothetical protein [Agrobacterium pusense]PZP76036.1 MAG: hypothetical protein DI604_02710 [Delftia acidovorans]QIX24032.1 hypothetical protein FOB41_23230 [Agrobacterium pusense]